MLNLSGQKVLDLNEELQRKETGKHLYVCFLLWNTWEGKVHNEIQILIDVFSSCIRVTG